MKNNVGNPIDEPLVSTIINNYNYARFLRTAIDSALSQTYKRIEVIVVDDGSTDESRSIIASYGNAVIPVYKPNGGQASCFNAGLEKARGRLIHFLDADDALEPFAMEEVVRYWRPGIAKVHFFLTVAIGESLERTSMLIPTADLPSGDLRSRVLKCGYHNSPPCSGNVYAREALDALFPMPEWTTAADTYPIFLSVFHGEVASVNRALGFYRVHGSNQDAKTKITARVLRERLAKDAQRRAMVSRYCSKAGLAYSSAAAQRSVSHLKTRLGSLALDRKAHPYAEDTRFKLAIQSFIAAATSPGQSFRKRAMICAWTVGILIVPTRLRQLLINQAFVPSHRPSNVQRALNGTRKPRTAVD